MDIIKLPIGEAAPAEADCIRIQQREDGRFDLQGTALSRCEGEELLSVALVESDPYSSYEMAEDAGFAWAEQLGIVALHVSRSDGSKPLPEPGSG